MPIYGSDVSHFDSPDTRAMFGQGIVFQTHKAGGDANDAEIGAWWADAEGHRDRVLLGAYWVLYPGSPVARADAFIAHLDSQCPGWRDAPFMLQLDCEKWRNDSATVPHLVEIRSFCDRLIERVPRLHPIVYAPEWTYGNNLRGLRYPLWASSYVTGSGGFKQLYPGDSSSRWAAYSGQVPAILQYSSSATIGGQTTSDANAFRGTLAQLTALVAPGWETDVTPNDLLSAQIVVGGTSYGSLNGVLATLMQRTNAVANQQMPALAATVAGLPNAEALAAALAPLLPSVPGITPTELQAALVAAFRELAAGS